MSRWLVTQNDVQFAVEDLGELKQLARDGKLSGGDMVQPPGATDWLYATEIPELKGLLSSGGDDDDLDDYGAGRGGAAIKGVVALILLAVLVVGGGAMWTFYQRLPSGDESLLGEGGLLSYSEMLVTQAGAPLRAEADASASTLAALDKDTQLELLAKRGDFYRARSKSGAEGWVQVDHVIPMYMLGGGDVRRDYDPLYNPDRYVSVKNASWLQLDRRNTQLTVFQFMLYNESKFDITDVVLQATIKDAKGNELEKVDIPIEGIIPMNASTMVGMLDPERRAPKDEKARLITQHTFRELAKDDPDLELRYRDGVEVEMTTVDFTEANIDIVELRAIPKPKK